MTKVTTDRPTTVTAQGDREILITREFAAPPELVFRAWTTPELVERWWGARRGAVTLVEIDLRVGGAWRFVMTAEGGFEVGFHGEYREIVPGERLVSTEVYEGMPDGEAVNTMDLTPTAAGTMMTVLVEHSCREHRDGHLASGMEDGIRDAFELLDDAAQSLA
ncbi:hypothetical protein DSM112329_01473 [Paraconexibacter sp. AEG42_29]|uniref:Activator of Hsp90 ATPase homologue 1/2-like C-terminal domain-containing protein n=1 Tax=Paraconexibacter sp. AEG42_29 TaxID=2997339 RepID=A0AAU7ASQ6_9ACTN